MPTSKVNSWLGWRIFTINNIITFVVSCTIDSTCSFINLQKYLQKRRIVKQMEKVNGVIYLRTKVVAEWVQGVPPLCGDSRVNEVLQGVPEALGPKWLIDNHLRPIRLGVEWRWQFERGTWRPPSLLEKLLSGGGIKVIKRAWRVPLWRAFVASQVVLLGKTWWLGSNTLVWSASTTWTRGGLVPSDTTGYIKSLLPLIAL
jgi:hypothetical protein